MHKNCHLQENSKLYISLRIRSLWTSSSFHCRLVVLSAIHEVKWEPNSNNRKNIHLSFRLLGFMTFEGTLFKERVCAMKMFANMAVLERKPIIFPFSFEDLLVSSPWSILVSDGREGCSDITSWVWITLLKIHVIFGEPWWSVQSWAFSNASPVLQAVV